MYLNEQCGLVYYAHPRTASCSTSRFLMDHAGFVLVGKHHGREPAPPGARSFTAVRNPWDVSVSWVFFHERGKDPGRWDADVFADHMGSRNTYIRDGRLFWHDQADEVIRFETLEDDLSRILGRPVALEHRNGSDGRQGRHYSAFYDDESRKLIGEMFAPEIERYGYTFEVPS